MHALQPEVFSSIVGDIYDCALNPDGWTATLIRVSTIMNAVYTSISLSDPHFAQPRMASHSPWDPVMLKVLNEEYGIDGVPGLREVAFGALDEPRSTLNDLSEAAFHATPFYQNWVQPQGLRDACVMKFAQTGERLGVMATVTSARRDIITAEERRFMALLSPHFRRAAMIGDLLDHERVQTASFRGALERLQTPVILAESSSRVLYANAAASALLDAGQVIKRVDGGLAAVSHSTAFALADAVLRAAGSDADLGSRGIGIPLSLPGQPIAVAYVLPLKNTEARSAFNTASAAIFISTSVAGMPPAQQVLATLYDLTPAESRVMAMMGAGVTAGAAAAELCVTENTVKTHLARVYGKTGVSRQSELVKLVEALAPPVV
jgi:DNA-binding CsgD family transcriptional regulator/PAS domain-containing protein